MPPVPETTNPLQAVELDNEAHARELERRAAAAADPCERERLLYLAGFARKRPVLPAVDPRASGGPMDENGRHS